MGAGLSADGQTADTVLFEARIFLQQTETTAAELRDAFPPADSSPTAQRARLGAYSDMLDEAGGGSSTPETTLWLLDDISGGAEIWSRRPGHLPPSPQRECSARCTL